MQSPGTIAEEDIDQVERVSPLELFFDLVFVLAITQVTAYLAADPSWEQLARGMLILAALWWAWVAYAWLTNSVNTEEDDVRIAFFVAMAAMLIVALSVPEAFDTYAALFAVAYLVVRVMHIVLYAIGTRRAGDADMLGAVLRLAPTAILAPVALIVASLFDGVAQGIIWLAALAVDYAGPALVAGTSGWRVSPAHFVERHGLIVIIALGESIVAVGVGAAGIALDTEVVLAATLGIVVAACQWWMYFDIVQALAERNVTSAEGEARNALARDLYSYLHLLLIAGIVLFALAMKKTISEVDEPLKTIPAVALCVGGALYLLGHAVFRLRAIGSLSRQRALAAVACLALIPFALEVDALIALTSVTAVYLLLLVYEQIHFRELRARVRAAH